MMNEIQVLLAKTVAGEDPETCEVTGGCTGDCASCHSACSKKPHK